MSLFITLKRAIKTPGKIPMNILYRLPGILKMSDERYLSMIYRVTIGGKLNLKNPVSFNEKLQWLKLNDRNPKYITMVDKFAVKEYVSSIIGAKYIIPTIGVWNKFDDIDFDQLPDQFVLKCTHDSGGLVICKDKKKLDIKKAKHKIETSMEKNFYRVGREWPYLNVPHRIIAETFISDENSHSLNDYKLFCFNGKVKFTLVCSDRFSKDGLKEDFYDTDWKHLNMKRPGHENSKSIINRPDQYDKMIEIAQKLSKDIPFVRMDFYEVHNNIYFGEITFYPASGFEGFEPKEWDRKLGEWIELPQR